MRKYITAMVISQNDEIANIFYSFSERGYYLVVYISKRKSDMNM